MIVQRKARRKVLTGLARANIIYRHYNLSSFGGGERESRPVPFLLETEESNGSHGLLGSVSIYQAFESGG